MNMSLSKLSEILKDRKPGVPFTEITNVEYDLVAEKQQPRHILRPSASFTEIKQIKNFKTFSL